MLTECNAACSSLHAWKGARWWPRSTAGGYVGCRCVLLGAADRVIGLTRLAGCFTDARNPALIEHEVESW